MVDKSPSGGYNREKQEKSWGDERPGVMIMTKADKYLVEDIKNILENGFQDVDPRPKYVSYGIPSQTERGAVTVSIMSEYFPIFVEKISAINFFVFFSMTITA